MVGICPTCGGASPSHNGICGACRRSGPRLVDSWRLDPLNLPVMSDEDNALVKSWRNKESYVDERARKAREALEEGMRRLDERIELNKCPHCRALGRKCYMCSSDSY